MKPYKSMTAGVTMVYPIDENFLIVKFIGQYLLIRINPIAFSNYSSEILDTFKINDNLGTSFYHMKIIDDYKKRYVKFKENGVE